MSSTPIHRTEYHFRADSQGHCYVASLKIQSIRKIDSGAFALQLDNEEGGVRSVFHISVTEALVSDAASVWFFALFFLACILLVANRYSHLSFKSKPVNV